MILRDAIDDLDVLIADLTELRQSLSLAELQGHPIDALWDAEAGFRRVAERATTRRRMLRRAIELLDHAPGGEPATGPDHGPRRIA